MIRFFNRNLLEIFREILLQATLKIRVETSKKLEKISMTYYSTIIILRKTTRVNFTIRESHISKKINSNAAVMKLETYIFNYLHFAITKIKKLQDTCR